MAKTVINLVKELGAKNTSEVMALLEQVGLDTHAEGFGVMTRVEDDVVAKLAALGLDPVANTPEAFDAMIKSETRKWTDIVRRANIKPLD